jgi:catechol-2,3-dioxygenase
VSLAFGHLVLRTARLAAMVEWYAAVLEARVVDRAERIVFMTYDEAHHRLAFVEDPGATGTRLAHVAFACDTLAELTAAHRRLAQRGMLPARMVDHRSSWSLYYADPDGGEVELFVASRRE